MWRKYPSLSPYVYAANNPLRFVDKDGKELTFASGLVSTTGIALDGQFSQIVVGDSYGNYGLAISTGVGLVSPNVELAWQYLSAGSNSINTIFDLVGGGYSLGIGASFRVVGFGSSSNFTNNGNYFRTESIGVGSSMPVTAYAVKSNTLLYSLSSSEAALSLNILKNNPSGQFILNEKNQLVFILKGDKEINTGIIMMKLGKNNWISSDAKEKYNPNEIDMSNSNNCWSAECGGPPK